MNSIPQMQLRIQKKFSFAGIISVFLLLSLISHCAIGAEIIENRGQWPGHVIGAVFLSQSAIFIENNGHTIHLMESADHGMKSYNGHVIKANIAHTLSTPTVLWNQRHRTLYHYHRNASSISCNSYGELILQNVLPFIDLHWMVEGNTVKYEWHIHPGGDPSSLQIHFSGQEKMDVQNNSLELITSLGEIREQPPLSWTITEQGKKRVRCEYSVTADTVAYDLPDSYEKNQTLIIDPELVFSTFSGSFSNNFGYTATYDQGGNLYSGSSAFGQNYPVTAGAYQTTHHGGSSTIESGIDMAISKYSSDGTTLIWSSFLGGSGDDLPLSMIVNQQMQLCIYGVTGSADFPVTAGAYDPQFSGGSSSSLSGTGANFPIGSDIIVCKFSEDGSELLASTYFGGNQNDGLNTATSLKYNYADEFRGEINLTSNGEILVVSSTFSSDFNFINGAQTMPSGGQDIIIASFSTDLTSLNWGSYAGGSGDDSGFSIAENFDGSLYITGGTTSTDFNGMIGYQTIYGGGIADAFILRLSPSGGNFISGTYFGGNDYDQFYFVSRDSDGNICVFGQTESSDINWIQNAAYSVAASGNCLVKLNPDLQTVIWSTLFGTGNNKPNLSPAAFMADLCNRIYICGWGIGPDGGGQLNPSSHLASMQNLATTNGCFDNTSVSGDFYMAVFDGNMSSLQYGSFIGGDLSSEHVDGGTSRFDRSGIIYQSVCAGCGGNSDFPIFPVNAWSATNNSSCNNAVLKFDFQIPMTVASFTPQGPYCIGQPVNFTQQSTQANDFFWQFGDGYSSELSNPQHTYTEPGIYEITLLVSNPQTCNLEDSVSVWIEIVEAESLPDVLYDACKGAEMDLGPNNTIANTTFLWFPEEGLDNTGISNPTCSVDTVQQYILYTNTGGCRDTSLYFLSITSIALQLPSDTLLCSGDSVNIFPVFEPQEAAIIWSDAADFSNLLPDNNNILRVLVDSTITYYAQAEFNNCKDSASIQISGTDLYVELEELYKFCQDDTVTISNLQPLNDAIYQWQSTLDILEQQESQITIATDEPGIVTLEMNWNNCQTLDSAVIELSELASVNFEVSSSNTIITLGESVALEITPDTYNYQWQPATFLETPYGPMVTSTPSESIEYNILIYDGDCYSRQSISIEVVQPMCGPPQVFVPNTFSPNNDGVNDKLFVRANEPEKLLLRIFNRWGEMVFETRSSNEGWDGVFRGEPLNPDVFTYYLEITCRGGAEYQDEGNITLTR